MGELARTVMNKFGEFARILSHLNPVLCRGTWNKLVDSSPLYLDADPAVELLLFLGKVGSNVRYLSLVLLIDGFTEHVRGV